MAWHGIYGHDDVVERFRLALGRGRLASSFLFVGLEGIGKRSFALKLAQALLCRTRPEQAMDPCGECPACVQVAAATHPDLELVAKPKDKSFLPLELLIGDKEHRMRRGLCHGIALKPFMGGRKIAIIDDADYLNEEGANSLLKTLEEPPPRSVLILIGTSPAKQLPTIRSRCQLIRFRPLDAQIVTRLLVEHGSVETEAEARRLSSHCGGSLHFVPSSTPSWRSRSWPAGGWPRRWWRSSTRPDATPHRGAAGHGRSSAWRPISTAVWSMPSATRPQPATPSCKRPWGGRWRRGRATSWLPRPASTAAWRSPNGSTETPTCPRCWNAGSTTWPARLPTAQRPRDSRCSLLGCEFIHQKCGSSASTPQHVVAASAMLSQHVD